jgi:hypothetical protein
MIFVQNSRRVICPKAFRPKLRFAKPGVGVDGPRAQDPVVDHPLRVDLGTPLAVEDGNLHLPDDGGRRTDLLQTKTSIGCPRGQFSIT